MFASLVGRIAIPARQKSKCAVECVSVNTSMHVGCLRAVFVTIGRCISIRTGSSVEFTVS